MARAGNLISIGLLINDYLKRFASASTRHLGSASTEETEEKVQFVKAEFLLHRNVCEQRSWDFATIKLSNHLIDWIVDINRDPPKPSLSLVHAGTRSVANFNENTLESGRTRVMTN